MNRHPNGNPVTSLAAVAMMTVVALTMARPVTAVTIEATTDVWLREAGADSTFEDDLISVWSSSGNDGARRYGVIEFDVSSLAGQPLADASLGLWAGANGFSDDLKPIRQSAVVIDTQGGTNAASLTWNTYQNEYAAMAQSLESLGAIDFAPTSAGDLDVYVTSVASAADRSLIAAAANSSSGLLSLVLIADEDGSDYAKSWGDGPDGFGGMHPILEVSVVPEPASIGWGALGGLIGMALRKRGGRQR